MTRIDAAPRRDPWNPSEADMLPIEGRTESWRSLHAHRLRSSIYTAIPRPLTPDELDTVMHMRSDRLDSQNLNLIADFNREVLADSPNVGLVLDGRGQGQFGFLGDMIEATRWIRIVRRSGRSVTVCTPHPELFAGTPHPNVTIVDIPQSVAPSPLYKQSKSARSYLRTERGVTAPLIFPINSHLPLYSLSNEPQNLERIDRLVSGNNVPRNIRYFEFETRVWKKHAIHQLQSMQVVAAILGFDQAANWDDFPPKYLYPDGESVRLAAGVKDRFLPKSYGGRLPIFVHPGVDPSPSKLRTKFYPEEKWLELIDAMGESFGEYMHLNFLTPLTPAHAEMTARLADYAREHGLSQSFVPLNEVAGWNLGAFAAFMQSVSQERGIMLGMDSLTAGHLFPPEMASVVMGSYAFDPLFYCPEGRSLEVLPRNGRTTDRIEPDQVVDAINEMTKNLDNEWA